MKQRNYSNKDFFDNIRNIGASETFTRMKHFKSVLDMYI